MNRHARRALDWVLALLRRHPADVRGRRALLRLVALGGVGVLLAACAGSSGSTLAPIIVSAFQAVAKEVVLIVPQLVQYGLSSEAGQQVTKYANLIQSLAGAVTSTTTTVDGASTLAKVEAYVNAIAPLVAPFVSLIPGGSIIGLIVAALPEIELAINFGASLLSNVAAQVAGSAPPSTSTSARLGGPSAQYVRINQLIAAAQ